jgi:cytochrome c
LVESVKSSNKEEKKMKGLGILMLVVLAIALAFPLAFAGKLEESIERGEELFKDRRAFGGVRACDTCHPNGQGLERVKQKTTFRIMGRKANSLEEAVNICIQSASKGTPIGIESEEMEDIVNYINSL